LPRFRSYPDGVDTRMQKVDVIIVGGGPAGLSAALVLGRCRRSVMLFDHGRYRNAGARAIHGFLTRDGAPPAELRDAARAELARYPSVTVRGLEVVAARREADAFEVELSDGSRMQSRKLLLATGVKDTVPAIRGLAERIGTTAFHCPYCDGWEVRDQPLFAYGRGDSGARFALGLTVWSKDVLFCLDGTPPPSAELLGRLERRGVVLCTKQVERVEGDEQQLQVVFRDGELRQGRALFYSVGCEPMSSLAEQLGLTVSPREGIETGRLETTSVEGLYAAGDVSRDALQAIVAAGEGSAAAVAINRALTEEDLWQG
jgi:thioredoxin reductase